MEDGLGNGHDFEDEAFETTGGRVQSDIEKQKRTPWIHQEP